jgi:hypothetical protein
MISTRFHDRDLVVCQFQFPHTSFSILAHDIMGACREHGKAASMRSGDGESMPGVCYQLHGDNRRVTHNQEHWRVSWPATNRRRTVAKTTTNA